MEIKIGYVYANDSGIERLAMSSGYVGIDQVVTWRTTDRNLPKGEKSHGSASLKSFQRWAVTMRPATKEDRDAFHEVESRRELEAKDARTIKKYKILIRRRKPD